MCQLKTVLILFACLLFSTVHARLSQEIIIAGQVINHESDSDNLQVGLTIRKFTGTKLRTAAPIDDKGYFRFEFDRLYTHEVTLTYNNLSCAVLMHPGDSLFVQIDARDTTRTAFYQNVKFSGDAAVTNRQLNDFKSFFATISPITTIYQNISKLSPENFKNLCDREMTLLDQKVEDYLLKNRVNSEVATWIENYLTILNSRILLEYAAFNQKEKYDENYFEFLSELPSFENPESWNNSDFFSLVNKYAHGYIRQKISKAYDLPFFNIPDSIVLKGIVQYGIHDQLLSDMVLNEFLSQRLREGKVELYSNNQEYIEQNLKNEIIRSYLHRKYLEMKALADNPELYYQDSISFTDIKTHELFQKIIQQNAGKMIYIDVWAVWCNPCISEFKSAKLLHQQYQDEDLVFVYLCIQSEKNAWQKLKERHSLSGQHYFLDANQSMAFKSTFNFNGVPYYILIDENGYVTETGSHLRPSGQIIKDKLKELF